MVIRELDFFSGPMELASRLVTYQEMLESPLVFFCPLIRYTIYLLMLLLFMQFSEVAAK